MSDYYEPHARVRLDRPIVLAGALGADVAMIGHDLVARSGLPFAAVDRLLEHEAGRALALLAVELGVAGLVRRVDAVLARAVRERPAGVIVLDEAWPSAESLALLRTQAHLVAIQRPLDFLERRRAGRPRSPAGRALADVPGDGAAPSRDAHGFPVPSADRDGLLAHAEIVIDGGELHAHRIVELLLASLEHVLELDSDRGFELGLDLGFELDRDGHRDGDRDRHRAGDGEPRRGRARRRDRA